MRNQMLMGVLGLAMAAGLPLLGGCSALDGGHADRQYDRDYRSDWRDNNRSDWRDNNHDSNDYARTAGDRNTRISDKLDDGRVNGSARSFEERKASRAADEGVPGAQRRENELRNDRLDR